MRLPALALVGVLVLAGCSSKGDPQGYPENYLLGADEVPDGWKKSEEALPSIITPNPGQVSEDHLSLVITQLPPEFANLKPQKAWVETFERSDGTGGGILIGPSLYDDAAKVEAAVRAASASGACGVDDEGSMTLLWQDGRVLVPVLGDADAVEEAKDSLLAALKAKSPGLRAGCG